MHLQTVALLFGVQLTSASPNVEAVHQTLAEATRDCSGNAQCEGVWKGISYRRYGDGSAVFEIAATNTKWDFHCREDAMDDSRSCILTGRTGLYSKDSPYIMVLWGDKWIGPSVSVAHGEQGYPGTEELLRIDRNPAFSVDEKMLFRGQRANAILDQMKRGRTARLRFFDWPYNNAHDSSVNLHGFSDVWQAVTLLRKQIAN